MSNQTHGDAYNVVRHIYDHSPGRSWQRLNGALHKALEAAITAHLSFLPDDFNAICRDMKGGYWMGNSCGSQCGERFYSLAVEVGHTPAAISFEKFADRPAALWQWDVKTPHRLSIGSELNWEGAKAHVTNIKPEKIVACLYEYEESGNDAKVGAVTYFGGGYRKIKSFSSRPDGSLKLTLGPGQSDISRKPSRIFNITYEQLAAKRKEYDAAKKAIMKSVNEAATVAELEAICKGNRGLYRPFDVTEIHAAIAAKKEALKELRATA